MIPPIHKIICLIITPKGTEGPVFLAIEITRHTAGKIMLYMIRKDLNHATVCVLLP